MANRKERADAEAVPVSRAEFLRRGLRVVLFGAVAAVARPRPAPKEQGRGYGNGSYGG